MKHPDICTEVKDDERQIIWRVLAYRKLTEAEAWQQVANLLLRTKRQSWPKPGGVGTIVTVIG